MLQSTPDFAHLVLTIHDSGEKGANVKYLWHGSSPSSIDRICQEGFDCDYADEGGLLGAGCYFNENASFSHKHNTPVSS